MEIFTTVDNVKFLKADYNKAIKKLSHGNKIKKVTFDIENTSSYLDLNLNVWATDKFGYESYDSLPILVLEGERYTDDEEEKAFQLMKRLEKYIK